MDHCGQKVRPKDPRSKANLLSKLTFTYAGQIFGKGIRNGLQEDDLYDVVKQCEAKHCADRLDREWEKARKFTKTPSVLALLLKAFGFRYVLLGLIELVVVVVKTVLEPTANGKVAAYFTPEQTKISRNQVLFYASIMIGLKIFNTFYSETYNLYLQELAIQVRTSLSSLIYRKSLKLSPKGSASVSLGNVVTILSKDVAVFDHSMRVLNEFWIAIIQAIVLSGILYARIGTASFSGIGVCLIVLVVQVTYGYFLKQMRLNVNKTTDERLQTTQETLSAIKIIKMYTWEAVFETKVSTARSQEMRKILKLFYSRMIVFLCGFFSTKIGFYLVMMTYIWLGNEIDAEMVFFTQNSYNLLSRAIGFMFPFGLFSLAEISASMSRVQHVLFADELDKTLKKQSSDKPKIELHNLSVEIENKPILQNITMKVKSGLTIISGSLGSGKSSLLKAMLHDYPACEGRILVDGSVSYASQDPWLFPSSIKQNILFGEPYNRQRYEEIIKVCALEYDFQLLDNGDETIVADKGLNLSKGQQARINLARAIYRDSNIYLLDDSLTALDTHVQQVIFRECIQKYLKDKICVLVSHNMKHIQEADHIIVLNNGRVKFNGKTEDLTDSLVYEYFDSYHHHDVHHTEKKEDDEDVSNTEEKSLLQNNEKRQVYKEKHRQGAVNLDVYLKYLRFAGGILFFGFMFILYAMAQLSESYAKKLISNWVDLEANVTAVRRNATKALNETLITNFNDTEMYKASNGTFFNSLNLTSLCQFYVNNSDPSADPTYENDTYANFLNVTKFPMEVNGTDCSWTFSRSMISMTIHFYSITIIGACLLDILKYYFMLNSTRRASVLIHKSMIKTVINCGMSFFDNYFIGNILNRFSQDLAVIDEHLSFMLLRLFSIVFGIGGIIGLIISINAIFILPSLIVVVIVVALRFIYIPTARSLKRLEASTRSPLVGQLNASIEGATTIRAYNVEAILEKEFDQSQNLYTASYYTSLNSKAAFKFLLDLTSTVFVSFIILYFLFIDRSPQTTAGDVGLIITEASHLSHMIEYAIISWADLEKMMTSVERVLEYTDFSTENHTSGVKPDNWPSDGAITFEKVSLTYNDAERILKDVEFTVEPMQKIGIVGRTGAGKSSIISTLFRLYNFEGTIRIDNVDTKQIPLKFLRENISIIPQDPVMFSGTIRKNIDPLEKYTDEVIWSALDRCKLKKQIASLDEIIDSGRNFSTGQRQLMCLTRAIVQNNKIVVLDEATANLDAETDNLVQEAIRENFAKCTIFTIAHRLQTVMDCHRVMVLEKGNIVEYDEPNNLLNNKNSAFYKMCQKSGLVE